MARRKAKVDLPGPRLPALAQAAAFYVRPVAFARALRSRYGPDFRIDLPPFGETAYLSDPDSIKAVFTGGDAFRAGEANWVLRPILGDHSVLLLDGDEHLAQRKMLLPPFHGDAVRAYAETVRQITAENVATWPRREPFAVRRHTHRITLEVIMRAVIGVSAPDRLDTLRGLLKRLVAISDLDVIMFAVFPHFGDGKIARRFPPYSIRDKVHAFLDEEIDARRASAGQGTDVLSLLVAARDEDGRALSNEELRDEIITLLVAGHETTATALAWALERLSRNPRVLARLYEEIDEGESDDYLEAVCRETLRVRPVIQDVMRRVKKNVEVNGHRIERGAMAMPAIMLAQVDGRTYDHPDEFEPERFLDTKPGTYTWLPFGGGTRRCIGAAFAVMEMKTVLKTVLQHIELATTHTPGERSRIKHVTLVPHKGARIAVEDRHPATATATVPPHGRPIRLARGHPRRQQPTRTR
jgi:cytochrome P450 family 135